MRVIAAFRVADFTTATRAECRPIACSLGIRSLPAVVPTGYRAILRHLRAALLVGSSISTGVIPMPSVLRPRMRGNFIDLSILAYCDSWFDTRWLRRLSVVYDKPSKFPVGYPVHYLLPF